MSRSGPVSKISSYAYPRVRRSPVTVEAIRRLNGAGRFQHNKARDAEDDNAEAAPRNAANDTIGGTSFLTFLKQYLKN